MSFFQEQGDDSNLQYDNAAFLYFIASALSLAAVGLLASIFGSLCSVVSEQESILKKEPIFKSKVARASTEKRGKVITFGLFVKILALLAVCAMFMIVYNESKRVQHKLKGFDPYEILGLTQNATLRQIKKAYRKLALEFHPDKNKGNAEAQSRFILISKSYECFTNEEKKANCFKYGNPDGSGSFRVGIGLPNFFIHVDYQYIVLPIVLTFLLVIVPWLMISWNKKLRVIDHNGISIGSYATIFKALPPTIDKFTFLYILTAYPEVYQDVDSISNEIKQQLFQLVKDHPQLDRSVLYELNDRQLTVFWQVYRYSINASDYTVPGLKEKIEEYLSKTLSVVSMFTEKELNDVMLYGDPDWTIKYLGTPVIDSYLQFQKDYYARTLLTPTANQKWLEYFDLDQTEKKALNEAISTKKIPKIALEILKSPEQMKKFLSFIPEVKRERIQSQMKSWPIYDLKAKLKLKGTETKQIRHTNYHMLYFKLSQINQTKGYSYIHNYPYPKQDRVYIVGIDGKDVLFIKNVNMQGKKQYVQKVPYRSNVLGQHTLRVVAVHETCRDINVEAGIKIKVTETPQAVLDKPVEFHPEDANLERLYKSFFEELIDISMDPEDNELSDSEDEDNKDAKEGKEEGKGEGEDDDSSSESEQDLVEEAND